MDLSGDISALVFKSAPKGDIGEFSLDSTMLQILMKLDGKTNIATIARALNMDMGTLRKGLVKLYNLKLIEGVESATPMLDQAFFDFLTDQLSMATGPIADVLIEDVLYDMGLDVAKVPAYKAAELVEQLSREIPREEKRVTFQQAMMTKISQIKT